jgi:hypothetical protein
MMRMMVMRMNVVDSNDDADEYEEERSISRLSLLRR